MTSRTPATDAKEPVSKSGLKNETMRDLDAKDQAAAVKGGRLIRKGGDPEEGGE
jgi:hypothetical protein